MTENRYLTILLTGDIQDTVNDEILRGSGIARRLNELNDEKKDLEEARSYYQENFLTMKKERNQLKEENEQLKEENKKLHRVIEENEKMIQSIYEELTKLRCIKSNLRRIKSNWDWIMEAIQYD